MSSFDKGFLRPNKDSGNISSVKNVQGGFNTTLATYQIALSKTGSGRLKELRAWTANVSYASILRVTIDGVVVFDGSFSNSTDQWVNSYLSPLYNSANNIRGFGVFDLPYKSSLLIELKSGSAGTQVDCAWSIDEGFIAKNIRRSGRATSQQYTNTSDAVLLTVNGKGVLKKVGFLNLIGVVSYVSIFVDGVQLWGASGNRQTSASSIITISGGGLVASADQSLNIPFTSSFQIKGYVSSDTGVLLTAYELD